MVFPIRQENTDVGLNISAAAPVRVMHGRIMAADSTGDMDKLDCG